jgi:hypothetical protein
MRSILPTVNSSDVASPTIANPLISSIRLKGCTTTGYKNEPHASRPVPSTSNHKLVFRIIAAFEAICGLKVTIRLPTVKPNSNATKKK